MAQSPAELSQHPVIIPQLHFWSLYYNEVVALLNLFQTIQHIILKEHNTNPIDSSADDAVFITEYNYIQSWKIHGFEVIFNKYIYLLLLKKNPYHQILISSRRKQRAVFSVSPVS